MMEVMFLKWPSANFSSHSLSKSYFQVCSSLVSVSCWLTNCVCLVGVKNGKHSIQLIFTVKLLFLHECKLFHPLQRHKKIHCNSITNEEDVMLSKYEEYHFILNFNILLERRINKAVNFWKNKTIPFVFIECDCIHTHSITILFFFKHSMPCMQFLCQNFSLSLCFGRSAVVGIQRPSAFSLDSVQSNGK